MTTLVSLEEFEASPYYDEKWADEEVEAALAYAEHRFYNLTNRLHIGYWLVARDEEHAVHGTGHELLRVPHPILAIESVTLVSDDETETEITDSVRFTGHYLWYAGKFPAGFSNVIVTGSFGDPVYAKQPTEGGEGEEDEDTVPPDVKEAVSRLAELKLRRARIAGERTADRRPMTPGGENPPPPTLTGDRDVDAIIKSYAASDLTGSFDFR